MCYTNAHFTTMASTFTRYHRDFEVVKMSEYYGDYSDKKLLMPTVGSNRQLDGMHHRAYSNKHNFKYDWLIHPDYNCVVKIQKKKKK